MNDFITRGGALAYRSMRRVFCMLSYIATGRKYYYCVQRQVGLGNRLIGLANLWSWFGKDHIRLVWGLDSWVGEEFEDLFEMSDSPDFIVKTERISAFQKFDIIPFWDDWKWKFWQLYVPKEERNKTLKVSCLYEKTPKWAILKYEPFFRQIKPSRSVLERIAECCSLEDVVTVFVRNSDVEADKANVCSIQTVFDAMDQYPNTQSFFISCMNEKVSKLFHLRYRERCLELVHKNYSSMVDAVADMYLLGRGKEMIALEGSTFPEVAWWLGGGRIPVKKLKVEYNQGVSSQWTGRPIFGR